MKKAIFILIMFSFFSCEKKVYKIVNGVYNVQSRFVEYEVGPSGYTDSTVYVRDFIADVDVSGGGSTIKVFEDQIMQLKLPNLYEYLDKVESNKKDIVRYENYYDISPDGQNDTLSVEINTKTLEIEINHIGHSQFFFPPNNSFSIIDYREYGKGLKIN